LLIGVVVFLALKAVEMVLWDARRRPWAKGKELNGALFVRRDTYLRHYLTRSFKGCVHLVVHTRKGEWLNTSVLAITRTFRPSHHFGTKYPAWAQALLCPNEMGSSRMNNCGWSDRVRFLSGFIRL